MPEHVHAKWQTYLAHQLHSSLFAMAATEVPRTRTTTELSQMLRRRKKCARLFDLSAGCRAGSADADEAGLLLE